MHLKLTAINGCDALIRCPKTPHPKQRATIVNDRLVIIRWAAGQSEQRAVYSYDPEANAWADPLPLPEEVHGSIKNGSYGCYDPGTNAFYCHFASDSRDDGTIWVYRFKK